MPTVIHCDSLGHLDAERLLMATVVPRPVVWVTTVDDELSAWPTLAPFSAVVPICNTPPLVILAVQRREDGMRKRTAANILMTREFVLNVIDDSLIEAAVRAADPDIAVEQRFVCAGVHAAKSAIVKPPRVSECEVSLECRLSRYEEVGREPGRVDMFIGEVLCVCLNEKETQRGGFDSQAGTFCGIGAVDLEWYLTRSGVRRIPQPYAELGAPLPPPLTRAGPKRK